MALKINSTKVQDKIIDENNNEIGIIEFDPEDASVYKKFLELIDTITEYQKIDEKIGQLEDIPDIKFSKIEEFEKYRGIFNKLGQKLDSYVKMREDIKTITNEIFGNVSETFEKVSNSIDPYIALIEWANPYFKEKRKDKVDKYLENSEDVL